MIGFWLANLVVPSDPEAIQIESLEGTWELQRVSEYAQQKKAMMETGRCAVTYSAMHPASLDNGSPEVEQAHDDFLALCLGSSYLTGMSVTPRRSLPHSDVTILQPGDHFPRDRSIPIASPVVNTAGEFKDALESFITNCRKNGKTEKILLITHHLLDTLACWSLEDLYLSATTVLQIIGATENRIQSKRATEKRIQSKDLSFFKAIQGASSRHGVLPLSADFKSMRNDLIHDGTLSGTRFSDQDKESCSQVACEVLNWIDRYLHAALGLGNVRRTRFSPHDFIALNAYSL
ncbi:hypothetical protein ACFL34_02965 [Candidatus Sumerlaeota bacterium]